MACRLSSAVRNTLTLLFPKRFKPIGALLASDFPSAVKPALVGEYPALVYFFAFAEYKNALAFSQKTKGAEEPLVLIRQYQWIDEPSPGKYQVKQGERITEWQVAWLRGTKRGPNSISEFLAKPRKPRD